MKYAMYSGPNYWGKTDLDIRKLVSIIRAPRWIIFTVGVFAPTKRKLQRYFDMVIDRSISRFVYPLYESDTYVHFSTGSVMIGQILDKSKG